MWKKLDQNSKRGTFLRSSENSKNYLIGIENEENSKRESLETSVLTNLNSISRKKIENDEEEKEGDVVFFGEVLKKNRTKMLRKL